MNVIVANKYQSMLEGLQIDVIKSLNGEFEADEIVSQFQNFFYQRMILDITAIKNYQDIRNLQKLSISLDMSKVILLLDDSPESSSPVYLSKLISMGIYNFTRNLDGIMYLYNNPNSYRDVAQYQQLDNFTTDTNYNNQPMAMRGQPANVAMQTTRIIGVKNITENSGATTLIYILKKHLEKNYSVGIVEVNKRDFMYDNGKIYLNSILIGTDNTYQNNPVVITEEEAINIAKNKEQELSPHEITNVTSSLSIEKMNAFIYQLENDKYDVTGTMEDETYYKTENITRKVWKVKIEHNVDDKDYIDYNQYIKEGMNKYYYVDATTGEIIGGDQAYFER